MKKLVICQHRLLHYRVRLFEFLRIECSRRGIELHIVCGQASRSESAKKDEGNLPWAHKVENYFWEAGNVDLVWQPFPSKLKDADLVILMQENRILSNYPLLLSRLWNKREIAFWGHGRNFQSYAPQGLRERWKMWLLNKVDWWFAYTKLTEGILLANGFPKERITCLNNAIDNDAFVFDLKNVSAEAADRLLRELDLAEDAPLGLFCGSLYPDKRIKFMIDAAAIIHERMPGFRFVVIGDGPSSAELQELIKDKSWAYWVGVKKGAEKACYFKIAKVVLNPGMVGLHIVDAFCAGLPLITTSSARHSPEIAYLENGVNGCIVDGSATDYAEAVIDLLRNKGSYEAMCAAALKSSERYTLENMAKNFVDGIEACLKAA
ncbi:MAG: glycosyltransferase [Nitrospirae bacterium]|nr:MAG: glycosyltransferase [Nitrospirota bacterium]